MSRYFSPKFLRYKSAIERGPIEEDRYCPHCGYNLRGLPFGRNCPECGQSAMAEVGDGEVPGRHDVILGGTEEDRRRWRLGLGMAAASIAIAVVARVIYIILGGVSTSKLVAAVYVGVGAVNCLLWIAAVFIITPPALGARWPWAGGARLAARVLALGWIVGYACKMTAVLSTAAVTPQALTFGNVGGRIVGGVGVIILAAMFSFIASEAELEPANRDLRRAVWLLPFSTPLAFFVGLFPFAVLGVLIFPIILYVAALVFWVWTIWLLFAGFHALYQHARWAQIHVIEARGRPERIRRKRRRIDKEVEATIRPLPVRDESEVAVEGPKGGGEG